MASFLERVQDLPVLGIGLSTEYGASGATGALKPLPFHKKHPEYAQFLEIGVEVAKGLDSDAKRWISAKLPTTYHFLDLNLDDPDDLDEGWLRSMKALIEQINPAWICGDAGLWHFGQRQRGQMLLLPPILTDASADAMAEGIIRLRDETGLEVFPENPPGVIYVGDLHLLDYFARVAERADTGLLLDCAHLAIYQRMMGHSPLDGLKDFPLDRVVEVHLAGTTEKDEEGLTWYEDDHTTALLPDTWEILETVVQGAKNLRAVVFECERNSSDNVLDGFSRIAQTVASTPAGGAT